MESSNQPFYRGGMDDQIVTAPNGARVNADYARFMENASWSEVRNWSVSDSVNVITGYGLPNYTFVEGESGLIIFDSGVNKGMGVKLLEKKNAFSSKPISAIVYTHHHYTGGAGGILERQGTPDLPIYGHPKLNQNLLNSFLILGGAQRRRGPMQMGHYLPDTGPDAFYAIEEPHFDNPDLNTHAHRPVTHPVQHGESVVIDGVEFVFYHVIADTDDSLVIHVPSQDLVIHNAAVMPFLFPLYTLRGDFYRSVPDMVAGIDLIRSLEPRALVGCHGHPILGRQQAEAQLLRHRDAYSFLYQQTVKGINEGRTPEELARSVKLPSHWASAPDLYPAYVDVEHIVRGIYRGLIGWWSENSADLYPPESTEFDRELIEGFGGVDQVVNRAKRAADGQRYNLAAKLLTSAVNVDQNHPEARKMLSRVLRHMAQTTPTGVQSRSYLLTEALHWEGKVDRTGPPQGSRGFPPPSVASMLSMPPAALVSTLQFKADAKAADDVDITATLKFHDVKESFNIAIRGGAVEITEGILEHPSLTLEMSYETWVRIVLRQQDLKDLTETGLVVLSGSRENFNAFLAVYSNVL